MENFNQFSFNIKEFVDFGCKDILELPKLINQLNKCFKKETDNFCEICVVVFKIKQLFDNYSYNRVYSKNNNNLSYNFENIMQGFNLDKTQTSRILGCYDKYICFDNSNLEKPHLIEEFKHFSKSKLFELLPVDNKQIIADLSNKVLRNDMSVKTIRDYVKNYQAQLKQKQKLDKPKEENIVNEINEEEIEMAYNPKQVYDFNYFESKSKAQLLNIVMQLQSEYQKLKKELKK